MPAAAGFSVKLFCHDLYRIEKRSSVATKKYRIRDKFHGFGIALLSTEVQNPSQGSYQMKMDADKLAELMLSIARDQFGSSSFERRQLMDLTERKVRELKLWSSHDEQLSHSTGTKTKGLAYIDYRFSDLVKTRELVKVRYGIWKLANK
jgi:hypothetical protein